MARIITKVKTIILLTVLLCAMAMGIAMLFSFKNYFLSIYRYTVGTAKILDIDNNKFQLFINGVLLHSDTYFNPSTSIYLNGNRQTNERCIIVSARHNNDKLFFTIGKNWVGVFLYGNGGFVELLSHAIISDFANSCTDIRDNIKGTGGGYSIGKDKNNVLVSFKYYDLSVVCHLTQNDIDYLQTGIKVP